MKRTPWYRPAQIPARRGFYERDHRQCDYIDQAERRISLDLWEPVADKRDILYPGVWYVQQAPYWFTSPLTGERRWMDGLNDASRQRLPWRGLSSPKGGRG